MAKSQLLSLVAAGLLALHGTVRAQVSPDPTTTPESTSTPTAEPDWDYVPEVAAPEPIFLFNVTFDVYAEKYSEVHNITVEQFWQNFTDTQTEPAVEIDTSDDTEVTKRDAIGGETSNDHLTREMMEPLHQICHQSGSAYRAKSGGCKSDTMRSINCGRQGLAGGIKKLSACPTNQVCFPFRAHNVDDVINDFPVCGLREKTTSSAVDPSTHRPKFSGKWTPADPGSVNRLHYHSFYSEAIGTNLHMDWNYQALAHVGDKEPSTFVEGFAHSVACINCPMDRATLTFTHWDNAQSVGIATIPYTPPTVSDFKAFFSTLLKSKSFRDKVVFWSGVTIAESESFAVSRARYTLEMLIGDTWEYFQSDIAHGGHWLTFGEAVDNFWDPASKTLAELAIDAVDAFFTPERAEEQKHPWCKRCWYRIEKPVLIASLKSTNNPKVTEIRKYLQVKNGAPHFDGFIKEMSD